MNYSRILVRGPNWIGDHVMARPFYRALRAKYPAAKITLLAAGAAAGLTFAEFDETIALEPEARRFPFGAWRTGRRLLARDFEIGFSLPATWSSALTLFAAGVAERVGFSGDGSRVLLTRALSWTHEHKSAQYPRLIDATPQTVTTPLARGEGIVIAPGASIELREWPHFRELVSELSKDHAITILGGPGEKKWSERFAGLPVRDLIGRTTLDEVVGLCRGSRLVIANDSGIAHVAATLAGAPTLVLFGPGDPDYIAPRGPRVLAAHVTDLPCRPCEKPYCKAPYGYQRCLRDLSVDTVLSAARRTLSL